MKKVGLLLAYKNTNYGAQLQSWATQIIIESLGFSTDIIEYIPQKKFEHPICDFGLLYKYAYNILKKFVSRKTVDKSELPESFLNYVNKRNQITRDFISQRLHNIVKLNGIDELSRSASNYSAIVLGSDQKWRPGASYSVIDSMSFVPKNVRRISYATSLGVDYYPRIYWHSSNIMWRNIDYLSVREKVGADIIKRVTGGIPVSVVLDPTYLISKDDWYNIVPDKTIINNPYVLCYLLGDDK